MTPAEAQELFAFNAWANRRIFDGVAQLAVADYLRDLKSSHGGVHGTLCHIVWAEHLWLTRWRGGPQPPSGGDPKRTRPQSSNQLISYAGFFLKKKKGQDQ